jgi:hypothetical protein
MFRARRIMRRRAIARNAATRGAGQEEQAPEVGKEATSPVPTADLAEQLEELAELREQGILTEEEFAAEKKKLVGT